MKRRLSTQDRLLSHISQALGSLTPAPSDDLPPATPLDQATSESLRGHQAMHSAAKAWFLGRRVGSGPVNISDQQNSDLDQHCLALDKTLDNHQTGRSLLLPIMLAGGFTLGATTQLLGQGRGQRYDADIIRRAMRARASSDACIEAAEDGDDQVEITTVNATSSAVDNDIESQTTENKPSDADTRRREYSLRRGRSPSEQLMTSFVSNSFNRLFKLTSKL